jgi:CrcB protein
MWIAVSLCGGLGAVGRTLVDRRITSVHRGVYPLGIFVVNITGSLLLGVMTGIAVGADARLLLGSGFLGGFTTFSTWIVDSRRLMDARLAREAALNIVLALLCGLIAAIAGWALGAWLGGSTRF